MKRRRAFSRLGQILLSVLGLFVVGYLLYHTFQGERGLFAMLRMENEVSTAKLTLEELEAKRKDLEQRTKMLRSESMDADLLDEKSRELLNYSKPNEIIILTPQEDK